jgi:exonuclease VII small subunit
VPVCDELDSSWQDGLYFICCIHYHHPELVDLHSIFIDENQHTLETAFKIAHDHFDLPLYNASFELDASCVASILFQWLPLLRSPTPDQTEQRHRDIFSNEPSRTTLTSTLTLQQLRITKKTVMRYADGTEIPTELEECEQKCSALLEKLNGIQHRLGLLRPTRSNYNTSSSNSLDSLDSVQDGSFTSEDVVKPLHPLQAAEDDYTAYDRHFKSLQHEFQTITDIDIVAIHDYLDQFAFADHPKVQMRRKQMSDLHRSLVIELEQSEESLNQFRRGFEFARLCNAIRQDLELVQNRMVKSITTHDAIQELEDRMQTTTTTVTTLQESFKDLLEDAVYQAKLVSVSEKKQLVQGWVEEVRVWYTEAQRIREWIQLHMAQLEQIAVPDPFAVAVHATADTVEQLNKGHAVLARAIESFDKEDMARLRSHVKTLTGSGRVKDLSPADTTTIEITLTTLTTLEKLTALQSQKSLDLQSLTQRVQWEHAYAVAMDWLCETDAQVNQFLASARWATVEQQMSGLMAKEKHKEHIVQQLFALERKMTEFDQNQFATVVDSFEDLDNTSMAELPQHLEDKQETLVLLFEQFMKRMTFARHVVEQRLNVMDFLYQTEGVLSDAGELELDLHDAEKKIHPGDNDREMTARVQNMHERIVQLVTATAGRIPYPVPGLSVDHATNTQANQDISTVINEKRDDLIAQSDRLDHRLHSFRHMLQLYRRTKEYADDAKRLCQWADERLTAIRKVKMDDAITLEELQRLERDQEIVSNKLKSGKINEVVDLLTRIQLLLETMDKLKHVSMDKEGLVEISTELQEIFDRLQQELEERSVALAAMRKKMEEGQSFFEKTKALRIFINDTRHSIPGLKQTCGFMTGQSEEQDKRRYDMLRNTLASIMTVFQQRKLDYEQIKHAVEQDEGINDLVHDWDLLETEINDLSTFAETVGQWYDCQRRLSMVENDLLAGLNENITQLAKAGTWTHQDLEMIQDRLDRASQALKETVMMHDTKDNPLQTANYACAKDRHTGLMTKLNTAADNLKSLENNASNAVAFSAFLGNTDRLLNEVQLQKEKISRRMTAVGTSGFPCESSNIHQSLVKGIQSAAAGSESDCQRLRTQLASLEKDADVLKSKGQHPNSVDTPLQQIQAHLDQLVQDLRLEKKQAAFIKKMQIHAKAAEELQAWMVQCAQALTQLPTDVCITEEHEMMAALEDIEKRMIEMRPTFQAFEAMPSRIFYKDGLPTDLCELSLDRGEMKTAVEQREANILKEWAFLKHQFEHTKGQIDTSKRGVAIARKLKYILTQVGDMRDRLNAVKICRNTSLDEGIENRDLNTVLSCPLTSIPTEHRLASAKTELGILERDIESNLHPSIQELDGMLAVCNEDQFSGQRAEVGAAIRGLLDILTSKRRAIAEAEKMEGFLTVTEELEVLLLALGEVVTRASPEEARKTEGVYSRTDLQALLIDLDTRYRYYEPKINELMGESKQVSEHLMDDRRVIDCLKQLDEKWRQLQADAASRKSNLMSRIGPLSSTFDVDAKSMLKERGRKAASLVKPVLTQAPSPQQSTPHFMTGYNRTRSTRTPAGGTVSPTARRVAVRQMAAQQQRQRAVKPSQKDTYVADPKNDLDVALGDIINDSPYKIQVKMVPGEVGKYWFGDANPRLAYCRILRSRMVMVRVGGGWVELSQFLRDHALLEGGQFVSKGTMKTTFASNRASTLGIRDGYLNAVNGMNRNLPNEVVTIRGGASPTEIRESRSTPHRRRASYGHGIKTGNKFLVTDGDGNQVEVKMTKAKAKDTKFFTTRLN